MTRFQAFLEANEHIVLDGAMGTVLMAVGLEQGDPPEEWNVRHPHRIRTVHDAYINAGAQMVLTNTFGGTSFRLKLHNLQDRVVELNQAAAEIAREAADSAPHPVMVAGSIGPSGEILEPAGSMTYEDAVEAFAEQAGALAAGGVDVIWIETMSDLNEAKAAVEGTRQVCDLPICATLTFDTHGRTMMGITPQEAVRTFKSWNLAAMGCNCGNGVEEIEGAIAAMSAAEPDVFLIAKSNAGIPQYVQGDLIYSGTPEVMADYARRVSAFGATLIGGCCGSSPEHIAAMVEALAEPVSDSERGEYQPRGHNVPDPALVQEKEKAIRPRRRRRR